MASTFPVPAPPRTPTPPTPVSKVPAKAGLRILEGAGRTVRSTISFDSNSLSPRTDAFPSHSFGSMSSPLPSAGLSPRSPSISMKSDGGLGVPPPRNPFNFQTQTYTDAPVAKSSMGQRRGHRYKHSSVSAQHQIFLEPPPRAPLAIPPSLPIPTFKEAWRSMSKEQQTRFGWCICHALVAAYVLYSAAGSLALTALSHLIFFDAISATICVVVDVFCNFEVWKRTSIRHPFGLERAEVLAGFAMSVFLLFMGFDLISHNLKHVLESLGSHKPHHPHSHQRISHGSVDPAACLSIVATLTSAYALKNHARISKALRFSLIASLPSVLSNPSHFLTISCSAIMLLLPLLSVTFYLWLDRLMCSVIAISMFVLGFRLAVAQGLMLLMSYSGKGVSEVMRDIAAEPSISGVEEARFWQVHYGLCMANLKVRVRGVDDLALQRLRERITSLVRNRLGGGYGKGGSMRWEVTMQFDLDGQI
ncbi:hypothetical protein BP5796_00647 [Coleophoma crateriformis]|uniref:Zinc transporter n=1 Tax=Coleophoma crateriformis TaxID=565419 RepID=A0A3D8T8N6_9HELO|nr:hypothetical protein BP5796_00647 [Coleophoma crateriformis]